jgi:hypothetical protein
MINKPLVMLGAVVAIAGFALMVAVLAGSVGPEPAASKSAPQLGGAAASEAPSRGWAVVAGVVLAIGAALVMLGMNRWRQPSRRRI